MALAAVFAGCATERPEPAGTFVFTPPDPGVGGGLGDAGLKPPGCGKKDDGSSCDCIDVPLFTNPPNMYFVIDHSGSMAEGEKWNAVRTVVAKIVRGLGPRANYGATVFPGFAQAACSQPVEVLPISPGDPLGQGDGPTTTKLLAATDSPPFGGTPTAEGLKLALAKLRFAKGKSFVVLLTDGGPNCNSGTPCTFDKCMPNIEGVPGCPPGGPTNCCESPNGSNESCLDGAATQSAVTSLAGAGFPVYVVGIPGSVKYAALLDQLAVAGGTAQATAGAKYFQINSSNDSEILGVLKRISAQIIATCDFELKEPPLAPENVNVYLDDVILPADPANGWKIDGKKVTLLGSACSRLLAGDILSVRIIAGCPTVKPR